ncbi:MAG: hypothetical protein WKF75_02775 [Singulisphaera sp.]
MPADSRPATRSAACVLVKLDPEGATDWAGAADALKEALMARTAGPG